MFSLKGPQGPQGLPGEKGPPGEGLPGPKVNTSLHTVHHFQNAVCVSHIKVMKRFNVFLFKLCLVCMVYIREPLKCLNFVTSDLN